MRDKIKYYIYWKKLFKEVIHSHSISILACKCGAQEAITHKSFNQSFNLFIFSCQNLEFFNLKMKNSILCKH